MKRRDLSLLCVVFFTCLIFVSCEKKATDYSQTKHWLALPSKTDKQVDVFYFYPTIWERASEKDPITCEIDNAQMLGYSKIIFDEQATAFETVGNIYAPYYRQMDVSMLTLPRKEQTRILKLVPVKDGTAAFDYYIKHYNNGRPYILAGHSQGADVILFLLSDYMKKHPDIYSRMVAAYVIGYGVTKEYLDNNPHVKFAEGPNDTGVVISYDVEAPGFKGNNPVLLPGSLAINPITWTRDEKLAPASKNLGSRVANEKGKFVFMKHYADARVDKKRGAVICSTVDPEKFSLHHKLFPTGLLHGYDIDLYYYNIRQNAENRTKHFLKKHRLVKTYQK